MSVVIINGHPDNNSFCHALAENYKLGADKAGNVCHLILFAHGLLYWIRYCIFAATIGGARDGLR